MSNIAIGSACLIENMYKEQIQHHVCTVLCPVHMYV